MFKIFLIKLQKKSWSLNNIVYIVLSGILHNYDILKLQIIIESEDIHRVFIHHSRLVGVIFKFIFLLIDLLSILQFISCTCEATAIHITGQRWLILSTVMIMVTSSNLLIDADVLVGVGRVYLVLAAATVVVELLCCSQSLWVLLVWKAIICW